MEYMEWNKGEYVISTDKSRLDLDVICGFLKISYWAAERTRDEVMTTIDNSICFGMYREGRQVGFCRLVTDGVVISWLGDVFVLSEYRGNGLGKWLMECVTSHPVAKRTKCVLGTNDAHGLYEQYGWVRKELMSRQLDGERGEL